MICSGADFLNYSNGNETIASLEISIRNHVVKLLPVSGVDMGRFLLSIAGKETSFASDNRPRYERAYDDTGMYALRSPFLQKLLKKYGAHAACSYGPWQILYCTAFEHGFAGHPAELWTAENSLPFVISRLNDLISNGASSIDQLADAWNSGSYKDTLVPGAYISAVKQIYGSLPAFDYSTTI